MVKASPRDVLSFGTVLLFTLMLAGTSKPSKKEDPKSDPSTTTTKAPTTPADLDLSRLGQLARCTTTSPHQACRILKDFEAGETYNESAAKVLWFGESYGVGGTGDNEKEPFFVTIETSPTGMAGAARSLIYDNAAEKKDGTDLLAAVKQGRTIPTSKAAAFMRTVPPPNGPQKLVKTTGRSMAFSEVPAKTFVRRRNERLIIVEFTGSPLGHDRSTAAATAWIAEAWVVR